MSIYAPDPRWKKLKGAILACLFLSALALCFMGAGLVLGTEPRLVLERSGPGTFRGTGSNYFVGHLYFTKTVDGISGVVVSSAARDRSSDSLAERQRRQSQKSLDLYGADRRRLGWDREDDQGQIEDFMRGEEPRLELTDPPPLWRMGCAWLLLGFGALVFIGAIQSNFFPKTKTLSGLP
jgi:hypothetical protein